MDKFKSRLEMIAYFISYMTDTPVEKCGKQACMYENKPFIIRQTCD